MSTIKKKIGIIIYARTSSQRLPNKVLLNIEKNKTLLDLVYKRVKRGSYNLPIIINTSLSYKDDKIVSYCKKNNLKYFRGSLKNVFQRTIKCCDYFQIDAFVRVCCDRPFFDFQLMKKMIKEHKSDITTNQLPKLAPKGLACEIANIDIFKKLNQSKLSKFEKEHIFDYFYKNKKNFQINSKYCFFSNKFNTNDFSIDTKKQFIKIKNLLKNQVINSTDTTRNILKKVNRFY